MIKSDLIPLIEQFKSEKNCSHVAVVDNNFIPLYTHEQKAFVEHYIVKKKLKLFINILNIVVEEKQEDISSIYDNYVSRVNELDVILE